jgi:hypothetical protein
MVLFTNAAQASSAISKVEAYFTSLTAQPQYTSVLSVMATAMPDSVLASMEDADGAGPFVLGTATQDVLTTQSWFTALPSDVKGYVSSVLVEEEKLLGVKVNGAGEKGVSLGLIAGGAGLVALMGFIVDL